MASLYIFLAWIAAFLLGGSAVVARTRLKAWREKRRSAREAAERAKRLKEAPSVTIGFALNPADQGDPKTLMNRMLLAQAQLQFVQQFVHVVLVAAEPIEQSHDEADCHTQFAELVRRTRGNRAPTAGWTLDDSGALLNTAIAWAASKRGVVCVPDPVE